MSDILIAEDEITSQTILRNYLGKLGYPFRMVNNGRDAIFQIERNKPRLLLLDIMMPIVDGMGVLQTVRNKPEWQDIFIIMLTSMSSKGDIVKAIQAGADDYIVKPVEFDILADRLNQLFKVTNDQLV